MTFYQNCSNRSSPMNKMAARAKNRKTFKQLLLLNQKMDFEIIIQECFLGYPLPKLLKRIGYMEQDGRQGYKYKISFYRLLLVNQWTNFVIISQECSLGDCLQICSNRSAPLNKMAAGAKYSKKPLNDYSSLTSASILK